MKGVFIVSAIALVFGIGVGLMLAGEETVPAAEAKAQPRPTVTVTETVTETDTVQVVDEVEVASQDCLDAIDAAEEIGRGVLVFAQSAGIYPELVGQAYEAGVRNNMAQAAKVLAEMEEANKGMDRANRIVEPAVRDFNQAKEGCRS